MVKVVQIPQEKNKIRLQGNAKQIEHARTLIHVIQRKQLPNIFVHTNYNYFSFNCNFHLKYKQSIFSDNQLLIRERVRSICKHSMKLMTLNVIQNIHRLQYSPRGVFATQHCSALKLNFNDQMGKIIDGLCMVLLLFILLHFYYN